MKLLDRYILRQFLLTFIMLVLGLPLLFIIGDITDNIDTYMDRGVPIARLGLAYVYQFPQFMVYAFPIAALVATVFTIGGLTRHQEITAAKAGGVSFWRLFVPVGLLSIVLSAGAFGLSEVVPASMRKAAALRGEAVTQAANGPRINFVFQTEREGILSVRRLDAGTGEMTELALERNATDKTPGVHLMARRAVWRQKGGWRLEDGWKRTLHADGREQAVRFDTLSVPGLVEMPEDLMAEPRDPEQMRYAEVTRFVGAIERSGGDALPLRVEQALKLSVPLAVIVIVLFGAPLVTSSSRGGTAYGVGISLGITIIYMLLFRVGKALGSSGAIDPMVAAWGPNLLFLVAGLVLMVRVRT
ncbi:MAG TPA: LptF/LptG family permease [Longimicrobium sp.]|jgi:lipopolysaccharide export system permease protein|uniref:LptF/LptG family permease n=1 Tax=Longimicrobium sp. TaxID=2029185 RepID=UPI002EDB0624